MIVKKLNAKVLRPFLVAYAFVAVLAGTTVIVAACYPKNCDPATDPLRCQCPPGACGPYPEPAPPPPVRAVAGSDAGKDAK